MEATPATTATRRERFELFFVSALVLFLELACIRWFPAHILFLSYFTNAVLLACFLGMSVGCWSAGRSRDLIQSTPAVLCLSVTSAVLAEHFQSSDFFGHWVPEQGSAMRTFWGTAAPAYHGPAIPAELLNALVFLVVAAIMVGPGQELGRRLQRVPDRIAAYSLNILGSIGGLALFAAASWLELSPVWWFTAVALAIGYFLRSRAHGRALVVRGALLGITVVATAMTSVFWSPQVRFAREHFWSPYYRVDYEPDRLGIWASLGSHQVMVARSSAIGKGYALPYLLRRDVGLAPFREVLIIGAGSGNDVSRALQWGAERVDAVEIDPVILRLGREHHPDQPYQDSRVTVHLDDGRNLLQSSQRRYDLVVYGNLDSVVLHSGYSSIRLESYLLTQEAFEEVRRHLKPGGWFVVNNGFPRGWVVGRIHQQLQATFGTEPMIFAFPTPRDFPPDSPGGYAILMAGDITRLRTAFQISGSYAMRRNESPGPQTHNGFQPSALLPGEQIAIRLSQAPPPGDLRGATDDWPFVYLRRASVPGQNLRGIALLLLSSLLFLLIVGFRPGKLHDADSALTMFFLGAGFLLLETKAVVQSALLLGSTWMVNTFVILAILVLILLANLLVGRFRPNRLAPFFLGLLLALSAGWAVPLRVLLGLDRLPQLLVAGVLLLSPVLFAGVIFATLFDRSSAPERDFGANIAGAMVGGLTEYLSLVFGFQALALVAGVFYLVAALGVTRLREGSAGGVSVALGHD